MTQQTLQELDGLRKFLSRHSNAMLDFLIKSGWNPDRPHVSQSPYEFMYDLIRSDLSGGKL